MVTAEKIQMHLLNQKSEKRSGLWSIIIITYLYIIISLSVKAFYYIPDDSQLSDDPVEFNGMRAKLELQALLSAGPRVVGSVNNEILAVKHLLKTIESIISESNGLYNIETDIQIVSGTYQGESDINVYESVQNVIVKMTLKNTRNTNVLLISSHFDSVSGSPGAGDDASMLVVMLEMLRTLSKSKNVVSHPVILLFNGAGASGMHASHGFMTKHKWAKDVKSFINLEGIGAGGKEMLLQGDRGNMWMLKYYGRGAQHPFASVVGEEIHKYNLLSDFHVFHNFGNVSGLTLAYISNGYVHRTRMDELKNIDEITLRHTGNNLLGLIRALDNAKEFDENLPSKKSSDGVYFDVFGWFFISISKNTTRQINNTIAVFSLVLLQLSVWLVHIHSKVSFRNIFKQFCWTFGVQLVSIALGTILTIILVSLIDDIDRSMSWYSNPWVAYGLYICPFLSILGIIPAVALKSEQFNNLPLKFGVLLFMHSQCIILILSIFILTESQVRSTFIITMLVIFYDVAVMINMICGFYRNCHIWIIPHILALSVPLAFMTYTSAILYTLTIPSQAQSTKNPESTIAFLSVVLALLMFGLIIPVFNMFRHTKKVMLATVVLFVISFVLLFTKFGFPYTTQAPQKHEIHHTTRTIYNMTGEEIFQDSMFSALLTDRNAARTLRGIATKNELQTYSWGDDSIGKEFYKKFYRFYKAPRLGVPNYSKVSLVSYDILEEPTKHRLKFQINGGSKSYRILISPLKSSEIVDWSFQQGNETLPIKPRDVYTVNLQFGKTSTPYDFWITLKVPNISMKTLSITLHATYQDEGNEISNHLKELMETFPKWTTVMGGISSLDTYEF